ncbi:hypothetical protein Psi02_61190 [Planotetraspora silvatica]|uniref:Uncharacterized protein n=1 Tax=Planotetraspora silvatica TaxID=234614 RepID=A0A8J3V4B7_9ACTN|nr:hypothetical protein [Planotetraspora silvatica]GII49695.1 hypothetical protein Psi02_61190 [Planotetraspora silvatica]
MIQSVSTIAGSFDSQDSPTYALDGRTFSFERVLAAPGTSSGGIGSTRTCWRPGAPPPMTVTDCALEPQAGGRINKRDLYQDGNH